MVVFLTDNNTTPEKVVLSCFGLLIGLWQLLASGNPSDTLLNKTEHATLPISSTTNIKSIFSYKGGQFWGEITQKVIFYDVLLVFEIFWQFKT